MPSNEVAPLQPAQLDTTTPQPFDAHADEGSLRWHLLLEIDAMARYSFAAGLKVPPEALPSLQVLDELRGAHSAKAVSLAGVAKIHAQLAAVVAPSLPRTIYLLQNDRAQNNWLSILGPLPAVRRLMLASFFFTLVFILSSLTSHINVVTMGLDIYRMDGLVLLNVMVFLMSAAGIGATFNALFTAHSSIANGTYDPRFESSFWSQIGLGVIAGLVISQVVPIGQETKRLMLYLPSNYNLEEVMKRFQADEGLNSTVSIISKPVLALVGGFSSTLVYTVLQRLVATLESLFKGNGAENRIAREQLVRELAAQKFGAYTMSPVPADKPGLVAIGVDSSTPDAAQPNAVVVPLGQQGHPSPPPKEETGQG